MPRLAFNRNLVLQVAVKQFRLNTNIEKNLQFPSVQQARPEIENITMAFMMPVVKNDWDIYKSNRSRRVSECSNPSSCRSRKVSECKSEGPSLSTSPGSDFIVGSPTHNRSVPANMSRQYSRASSRTSESSLQSPVKSVSSSPPKNGSQSSLNKFHNRLLDKLKRSLRKDPNSSERTSS